MQQRIFTFFLLFLLPLTANAVYFPDGIDWTNPSQSRFVQSLYLNMLGRAPDPSETRERVNTLRRNDNRTARLRIFESIVESSEYRRVFTNDDRGWQVYQSPDYNYNSGVGFWRYQAGKNPPENFQELTSNRAFPQSIALSIANYYNAFCYRGEPCIDNPELARDRHSLASVENTDRRNIHACAIPSNLTSQFKWVAVNGTTYPRGIGRSTICIENSYFNIDQLALQHYQCDDGFENCRRNPDLDFRASRSGTDNNGDQTLFFRDGSRLTLMDVTTAVDNAGVVVSDSTLLIDSDAHDCADSSKTTSRFTWVGRARTTESVGIGANTICMDNYYYAVQRLTLARYNCSTGFTNCTADPQNNLNAKQRTRVNGKPGLLFANGTTLALTARDVITANTNISNTQVDIPVIADSRPQLQIYSGADCAVATKRVSQFRWKSNSLNSWPDGVDGRFICQPNSYYEIEPTRLRYFSCQSNYSNCRGNPLKDININQTSEDGKSWVLGNGDQLMLISR